jgi:glycosyltransferase involved in cell wall biosynthesis
MSTAAPPRRHGRILLLNQYYAPDAAPTGGMATEISGALARNGMPMLVIAAEPSYLATAIPSDRHELGEGVEVRRIRMGRFRGRESLRIRLAGYLRYLLGAALLGGRAARKESFSAVMTFHNPPFIGLIGASLARRQGVPFIYLPQDIHPDILIETGWLRLPACATRIWDRLGRLMLRRASRVIVVGEGMRQALVSEKGVSPERIDVIPPFPLSDVEPQARDESVRRRFLEGGEGVLISHFGNMGVMHPLDPLFEGAEQLRDEPVHLVLSGGGVRRRHWESEARRRGLTNVTFIPFQDRVEYERLLAASDLGVVALRPGLERLAVPSRSFTLLAAGIPLLTVMAPRADVAELAVSTGCGWNVSSGEEVARLVRSLLADPTQLGRARASARSVYEQRYQRSRVLDLYVDVIGRELRQPARLERRS